LLDHDSAALRDLTNALDEKLAHRMGVITDELASSSAPEVQRALEEVRRRAETPDVGRDTLS
jgi:RecA/RadA recombinase